MMKYILLIVVLSFISSISNGQNLDKAIDAAVDARYKKGMIPVEGYDSIQNVIVNNYIQKEVLPLGIFNWPSQVIRFYPSETYKYLLVHKYNIGRPILHGCIVASYQYCYDSIIANELRKKYGNDFFEKSKAEADLLDSNKMGVTLPYLFNSQDNAISAIKKEMPLIDTFRFENNDDSLRFIILNFKGNALINAYFGEPVWGIQASLELLPYSKLLTQILNKLKWDGPKFKREPIEKAVLWDFRENTFNFYGW